VIAFAWWVIAAAFLIGGIFGVLALALAIIAGRRDRWP